MWLDGVKIGDLSAGGQYLLENPQPGDHTLKVVSGRFNAVVPFVVASGVAPAIGPEGAASELKASELKMVVVSSYRSRATVHASLGAATLTLDGTPAGTTATGGTEIAGFGAGSHQLVFKAGLVGEHQVGVDVGPNPSVFVSLSSDRNVGAVVVTANEEDYKVFVDEKLQTLDRQKGNKRTISNLDGGPHVIRIAKDDYRAEPESHPIEVKKGRQTPVEFALTRLPQEATLLVEGAPAGMEIVVGGRQFTVPGNGRLQRTDITPGEQKIEIRRTGYKSKTFQRTFEKRQTVRLAGSDLSLDPTMINFSSPSCRHPA